MGTSGKNLRECRDAKGIWQSEVAKLLNTHHSILIQYKRDEVNPTMNVVEKPADTIDTTMGYLLGEIQD